jgi:ATP-binding cassette subfamily B protein
VRNARRILVFEQGRIVEAGSFDELIRHGGVFAALARAQFLAPPAAETTADAPPVAANEPQASRVTEKAAE